MLSKDIIDLLVEFRGFSGLADLFLTSAFLLCRKLKSLDKPTTEAQEEREQPSDNSPRH